MKRSCLFFLCSVCVISLALPACDDNSSTGEATSRNPTPRSPGDVPSDSGSTANTESASTNERSEPPVTRTATTSAEDEAKITVYATRTGKKYHRGSCRYLRQSKIAMSLSDARRRYSACSVCKPPS